MNRIHSSKSLGVSLFVIISIFFVSCSKDTATLLEEGKVAFYSKEYVKAKNAFLECANRGDSQGQFWLALLTYKVSGHYSDTDTLDMSKEDMYKYERKISGSDYYSGTNPNSWTGKIAPMYASDCGYAVSDECTQTLWNYNNSLCKSNSWLYNTQHEWLLNQSTNSLSGAFQYLGSGIINYYNGNNNYSTNTKRYIRPTLYLVSNVQITGGTGTSTDPYTFGL